VTDNKSLHRTPFRLAKRRRRTQMLEENDKMNLTVKNGILALVTLAIPLVSKYVMASPNNIPGTGFDVLLYEPFDFAYILPVTVFFIALNIRASTLSEKNSKIQGVFIGIAWAIE
jgi:hypothetical protein